MKKMLSLLITISLALSLAPAFADGAPAARIVCAAFPQYDWVMNILGEEAPRFEVTLLMDSGADLHSYQPTARDMANISSCDLFIYAGGESDKWVENVIAAVSNDSMLRISMLGCVEAKQEEILEGMQAEDGGEQGDEGCEIEYDEHVWLSIRCAIDIINPITETIASLDPERAEIYRANSAAYVAALTALDGEYAEAVKAGARDTLLFADRFPFRYLADDYSLNCFAAFVGCSAESEASFETIAFLAKKVDELGLRAVLVIDGSDQSIAKTVIANAKSADQEIIVMNSMQSVTRADIDAGASYIAIMRENLSALTRALQ